MRINRLPSSAYLQRSQQFKTVIKRSEILPIDRAPSPGDTHPKVLMEMETEIGKPVGDILTSSAEQSSLKGRTSTSISKTNRETHRYRHKHLQPSFQERFEN